MNLAKKILHNTLVQIGGKALSTILGIGSLALITRYLNPHGFGEYTTVLTFLTFFAVASDFGLTLVSSQMISSDPNHETTILNNLFGLRLISSLLVLVIAPLIVYFFPYSSSVKLGVLISFLAFLFPALNQVIIGLFQKKLSMERDSIAEVFSRVILIIGIILAKHYDTGLTGILIATVISGLTSFIVHYLLALKFITIRPAFDWPIWHKIFHKSWPLTITIVLNLIYLRADTLLLSVFRPVEEVGLYGAAYKIIDIFTSIPFMFAGLILPLLTLAWQEKRPDKFSGLLQKSFDFMALLAVPVVIGSQFLAKPVMRFAAGSNFAASGLILQVLVFAVAAIFMGTMFSHAVIALDQQKKMIGFYIFTSLSSLAGYLIFIPRFSYFGAAGVTIYSETLIAIFSAICVYKYSRFRPKLKILWHALMSSLAMAPFLYFLAPLYDHAWYGLLAVVFSACLIYFAVLYWVGGIKRQDLVKILQRSE
jgi:O-antigen/teichoic acid export membrane protein